MYVYTAATCRCSITLFFTKGQHRRNNCFMSNHFLLVASCFALNFHILSFFAILKFPLTISPGVCFGNFLEYVACFRTLCYSVWHALTVLIIGCWLFWHHKTSDAVTQIGVQACIGFLLWKIRHVCAGWTIRIALFITRCCACLFAYETVWLFCLFMLLSLINYTINLNR